MRTTHQNNCEILWGTEVPPSPEAGRNCEALWGTWPALSGSGRARSTHPARNCHETRPDPHVHSTRFPKGLHFAPSEPQVHSARSPKSLRESHISTPWIAAKWLSALRFSHDQLFKLSSVLSQSLKASPAAPDILTVN